MYVEQVTLTVPKGLKGEIRRPDFLVGIPTIGTLAFDVKAKHGRKSLMKRMHDAIMA